MGLQKVQTDDKDTELMQRYVEAAIIPLQQSPLAYGNMISGVRLASGQDNLIAHKLGSTPKHFMILDHNADARVWSQSSTVLGASANAIYINLRCSASVTVSVWVV